MTKQQNQTGWQQVLQGRVTRLMVQNHDKWKEKNQSNLDGEQWTARLTCHLWQCTIDLWKHCNDELHGKTKSSTWHRQNVQDKIRTLHRQKGKIDSSNQHALEEPINAILNEQTKHMEEWLKRTTPRVTAAI